MTRPVPAVVPVALVLAGMLPACTHRATPEDLAAVERMIQANDSMRAELERADTNALRHTHALFEAERPAIAARFKDTLLPHEAEVLGNYHAAMSRRLPLLLDARAAELSRIDSAALRLRDLRHDMENGLMGKEERSKALAAEQRWGKYLRNTLDSLNLRTQNLLRDRRTLRSAIDTLLHP
jgi:hypothetical protein